MGCCSDNNFIKNENQPLLIHPNNDAIRSIPTRLNINLQQQQQHNLIQDVMFLNRINVFYFPM